MAGRTEQVRTDLVTTGADKAAREIDKVADAAKDLEDADPTVKVKAEGAAKAEADIEQVGDAAAAVARADHELVLRARVDAAKAELATLQNELKVTGEKAEDTARQLDRVGGTGGDGLQTRGNAIADLTGPLGDASGAASDFAGVFEGLGDIAQDAAGKLGASASASAAISGAVGGLGIVVAAGAAAWQLWRSAQERAKQKQEELRQSIIKINDAVKSGRWDVAADNIIATFDDVRVAAKEAGITTSQFTDYLTGAASSIPGASDKIDAARAAFERLGGAQKDAANVPSRLLPQYIGAEAAAWLTLGNELDAARDAYATTTDAADKQATAADEVAAALKKQSGETGEAADELQNLTTKTDMVGWAFDRLRGKVDFESAMLNFTTQMDTALAVTDEHAGATAEEIIGIKNAILDVAGFANLNPIQVEALLKEVDKGNLTGVKALIEQFYKDHPVGITAQVKRPTNFGGLVPDATGAFPSSAAVVVNQNFPRGIRVDASREAHRAARRNGTLYQRLGR